MGEMFIWSKLGQNPSEIDGALNHATRTVHFRYVKNKSDRNNTVCVDEVMWCLQ